MAAKARRPTSPSSAATRSAASDSADESLRQDHVTRAYQELRRIIVWGQLPPG